MTPNNDFVRVPGTHLEREPDDDEAFARYQDNQPSTRGVHDVKEVPVKLTETLQNKRLSLSV